MNIFAVYPYRDAKGKLLFEVCRLDPKDFRQRRPDTTAPGKWIWNLKGVELVPYRLPELKTAVKAGDTVLIAEGEKDVAALVANKFAATCNAGGAGKWQNGFAKWFDGAKAVVIIADKDTTGRKHAAAVAENLKGKAQSVKVIELPDVAGRPVKDPHDFFEAGGTADQLREIAEAAPEFETPAEQSKSDNATDTPAERVNSAGLICIADETKIATVPLYYYAERQQWFYANGRGGFFKISDSQAKVILAEYGFNRSIKDPQGNTVADRAHSWKMQRDAIAYAGELAGYPAGCHDINGTKILATNSPRMITPNAGKFPKIQQLVETMLADDEHPQAEIFCLWLSKSYVAFVERFNKPSGAQFRHAPALYIAGPPESGKTALIDLVLTPLFGGRKADPMNYLREPKFNKDLFAASLLVLDDKGAGSSLAERRERGERIKDMIWKPEQRMEAKGCDAVILRPFWRLVLASNDDDAGLQLCPTLSPSLEDKLLILRARRAEGLPTTNEENDIWAKRIADEIPAFAHWLLRYQPHAKFELSPRTRLPIFQHPAIVAALHDLQPEMRLLEMIDTLNLIGDDTPHWEGHATEFEQAMRAQDNHRLLDRIFSTTTAAGRHLAELARIAPNRVEKTNRGNQSYYRIFKAQAAKPTNAA